MTTTTMQEEEEAKAKAKATKASLSAKRGKMRFKHKLILIIVSLVLVAFLRTGVMFVIIGVLPSIVAHYMDVSAQRYAFKTIFSCNLCGILPFVGKMLYSGPSSAVLQHAMGDFTNWVIIYGSALIGWVLVEVCPMIAGAMIVSANQTQIARIKRLQQKIEGEWGPEVTQLALSPQNEDD